MKTLSLAAALVAGLFIIGCNKTDDTPANSPGTTPVATPATTPTTSPDATPATSPDATPATTGGGTASMGGVTEADLGVPFYPGSKEKPNASAKTSANGMDVVTCVRTTSDAPDKVLAFYKDKATAAGFTVTSAAAGGTSGLSGMKDGGKVILAVGCAKDPTGSDNMISIGVTTKK